MRFNYLILGILVNFLWGLVFFVPYYFKEIDPVLVVLSRFFFYGSISVLFLFFGEPHWRSLTRLDWNKAMIFAFIGNIGYYFVLTLAIHYAGIALPALIVGTLPITMMIYANFTKREFPIKKLVLPIILIFIGIVSLKYFQYANNTLISTTSDVIKGILFAIFALIMWTWFGVENAVYLKKNLTISGQTWSHAIGVCCFLQVLIIIPIIILINKPLNIVNYDVSNLMLKLIFIGLVLGVIVSWLATGWWNKVSRHLPTTIVSQLLVFETISSLLYSFILNRTFPQPIVLISIGIVLLGIIMSIRMAVGQKIND